jgi:hypothetical protein
MRTLLSEHVRTRSIPKKELSMMFRLSFHSSGGFGRSSHSLFFNAESRSYPCDYEDTTNTMNNETRLDDGCSQCACGNWVAAEEGACRVCAKIGHGNIKQNAKHSRTGEFFQCGCGRDCGIHVAVEGGICKVCAKQHSTNVIWNLKRARTEAPVEAETPSTGANGTNEPMHTTEEPVHAEIPSTAANEVMPLHNDGAPEEEKEEEAEGVPVDVRHIMNMDDTILITVVVILPISIYNLSLMPC